MTLKLCALGSNDMISSAKLEQLAHIGGFACEAAHDNLFATTLLSELESLLDADGAVFYDMSGPFARPVFGESCYRKIEREYGELYGAHYNSMDPCFNSLKPDEGSHFLASASTMRAIDALPSYVESEYYQDFLKPQAIHTSIIFTLNNEDGLLGLFGFQRPENRDAFDDESHLLVRLAAAPIAQALDRRRKADPQDGGGLHLQIGEFALTPRQVEIAKLVTLGLTNSEISRQLGISPKTVENHLTRIYELTRATNRVTLAQSLSFILANANSER